MKFELEKAEHGMALPYDAERVMQLRSMLRAARKQKLSAGLRAKRERGSGDQSVRRISALITAHPANRVGL